jgi:hypothetical protein
MSLEALRPTRKDKVFDLVEEAGFDTADWIASAHNCPVKANPKYCYEWAFVEPGKVAILNLWWDMFEEEPDGSIVHRHNFRADANGNIGKPTWVTRATRLDQAVQSAAIAGLELRVIINDGRKRNRGDPHSRPSRVTARQLDPEPWTVTYYNRATGAHVITRGLSPRFVDQFDIADAEVERIDVSSFAFKRDPAVRAAVLRRAYGKCEYCGELGFKMANGSVYLETHHVIPLCEGGKDSVRNVAALCPNDHKRAHFAAERVAIRAALLSRINSRELA